MTRPNSSLVPFYSNTPDNIHCLQASSRMILGYFLPNQTYTWKQLDIMAARKPGFPSWTVPMLMSIHDLGFDIHYIRPYDGDRLIREGEDYLREILSKKAYEWHVQRGTDVADSQRAWQKLFHSNVTYLNRIPTLNDIETFLDSGYLILSGVNIARLNGVPGYEGHFLVIYDIDDEYIYLNDPGLPAVKNRKVKHSQYEKATKDFGYTIAAVRYPSTP